MAELDFISQIHKKTKRDYVARVTEFPKEKAAELAKKFDYDYWDGDRTTGYGGYKYDGRWAALAKSLIDHYKLTPESKILDVGCGKGFLLYDFTQLLPGITVKGIDISKYAIEHAKEEVKEHLQVANANSLPFDDKEFDLVISINTLHNLLAFDMISALKEMERVAKNKYLVVESYRSEAEKVNLMYWQLTCECFFRPEEWAWFFDQAKYTGDHAFIYFE